MAEQMNIVLVEDDQSVREMLSAVLSNEGHAVTAFENGEDAVADQRAAECDLLILDVGLPKMSGIDVCRRVRLHGRFGPILVLTARHDVHDRVEGLDAGADDYLVKPFSLDELFARIRALCRRYGSATVSRDSVCSIADLVVDPRERSARRNGVRIELTQREFDLLYLLVFEAPSIVTRELIHDQIWATDQSFMSNSLEVFISQLRRKTEIGGATRLIHTIRGVGYAARDLAADT